MKPADMQKKMYVIEHICKQHQIKLTKQRLAIVSLLLESKDHPSAESLYESALKVTDRVSLATVYRTLSLLEMCGVVVRHDFGDKGARYEIFPDQHHDHLIDMNTGKIIEFQNEEIEILKRKIARDLGYDLVDHRLELFAVPIEEDKKNP